MDSMTLVQQAALQLQGQQKILQTAQPAFFGVSDNNQALTHQQMMATVNQTRREQMVQQRPGQQHHVARPVQSFLPSQQPTQARTLIDRTVGPMYTQEQVAVIMNQKRQAAQQMMMAQQSHGQQHLVRPQQGALQPLQPQPQTYANTVESQVREMQLRQDMFQERARQQAVQHQAQMAQQSQSQSQSQSPLQMQAAQQMSPPAKINRQQLYIADRAGRKWTQEQYNEIVRLHAAQSGQHRKQPTGPKNGVQRQQKAQNQARPRSTEGILRKKVPEAFQVQVPATSPAQTQTPTPAATPAQTKPSSATQARAPKPLPCTKATRFSISARPPNGAKPADKVEDDPQVRAARHGITMADVENGDAICNAMTAYLSAHEEARSRAVAKQTATPAYTLHDASNIMETEHAASLRLPTGFDMGPVVDKVRDPVYDGYASYSGTNGGVLPVVDNDHVLQHLCTRDADGGWRANDFGEWSETAAELEWQIQVTEEEGLGEGDA